LQTVWSNGPFTDSQGTCDFVTCSRLHLNMEDDTQHAATTNALYGSFKGQSQFLQHGTTLAWCNSGGTKWVALQVNCMAVGNRNVDPADIVKPADPAEYLQMDNA